MIDVSFDFQAEVGGKDSDRYSKTLQEYHRVLWSKALPSGRIFELSKISSNRLHHKSDLGEFYLSSDRAVATFSSWKRFKHIAAEVAIAELERFNTVSDTIGGILIWPSTQVDGLPTINAERGFNTRIADRMDLTIECVRRYYLGEESPLTRTFSRYNAFFSLFEDFKGYIDFFLLQDAVSRDYKTVKIAKPFDDFHTTPVPRDVDEYQSYITATTEFVINRNIRIAASPEAG